MLLSESSERCHFLLRLSNFDTADHDEHRFKGAPIRAKKIKRNDNQKAFVLKAKVTFFRIILSMYLFSFPFSKITEDTTE